MWSSNSFKPNLLRYTKHMAGKACHVFGFTTQVGLIPASGRTTRFKMFNSTKIVLGLAVASAAVAGLFYWWWMRLIIGTFSICAGGDPGVGVDCRHIFQFYAAILFAAITLILLLVAVIRAMRSARGCAAPAE